MSAKEKRRTAYAVTINDGRVGRPDDAKEFDTFGDAMKHAHDTTMQQSNSPVSVSIEKRVYAVTEDLVEAGGMQISRCVQDAPR